MTFQLRNIRDIPNIVDAKLLYYHSYYQNLSNKYNLNLFRMRIKSIFAVLLAIATMASCSDNVEGEGPDTGTGSSGTAYMSLNVTYPTSSTKAGSTEEPAEPDEAAIKEFYVLTFDGSADKKLIKHSNATTYYTKIDGSVTKMLKVNPDTKYLLVVANPGAKMQNRLGSLTENTKYSDFNEVITLDALGAGETPDILVKEIVESVDGSTGIGKHFTMINVGTYDTNSDKWPDDGLLDVGSNVKKVDPQGTYPNDAAAQAAASSDKATLKIERLAAKIEVDATSAVAATTTYPNAKFEFGAWILDYRNSTFFPYAKKTKLDTHNSPAFYENNFYTEDPNYILDEVGKGHENGIILNKADDSKDIPADGLWKDSKGLDYCIENTMEAKAQKFGAATRLVIKGLYTPNNTEIPLGTDWFFWDNKAYTIATLKAAYNAAKTDPTEIEKLFIEATDNFLIEANKINSNISTSDIDLLDAAQLTTALIPNGGEITKINKCLRWYQGGLNYYYYEIRHDNSDLGNMEFGKYGVVRNNWYNLNLKNVTGKGTPWYPGGGPEDPDPGEDIDQENAYLDFEIEVGPWVYWTTDFDI